MTPEQELIPQEEVKACLWCKYIPEVKIGAVGFTHIENGCLLSGLNFRTEAWNSRPTEAGEGEDWKTLYEQEAQSHYECHIKAQAFEPFVEQIANETDAVGLTVRRAEARKLLKAIEKHLKEKPASLRPSSPSSGVERELSYVRPPPA